MQMDAGATSTLAAETVFEPSRWRLAPLHYKSLAITAELSPFPECVSLHFRTGGWKAEKTPDSGGGPRTARPPSRNISPVNFQLFFLVVTDTRAHRHHCGAKGRAAGVDTHTACVHEFHGAHSPETHRPPLLLSTSCGFQ